MPSGSESHTYHTEKMKRCIQDLLDKGHDEGSAHAICYSALGSEANKSEKEICPECAKIAKAVSEVRADHSLLIKKSKQRYTLGIVYEPDTLDTDGEYAKAEDIEAAAWDFMRELQAKGELGKAGLDVLAKVKAATDSSEELKLEIDDEILAKLEKRGVNAMHLAELEKSEIVESFIAPSDMTVAGQQIKKGSWLAGIIWDEDSFKKIESGDWTGYSMGGWARKVKDGNAAH